jgi:glycine C-acetyltransferase
MIATDGVFSMDGVIANLPGICDLADRYNALVMVDDSHSTGVLGKHGKGTHEHHGVIGRIDILTGTLGKALGGATGGYTAARKDIVEFLRQRSRPYLFSNSVAPAVVGSAMAAIDLLSRSTELCDRLRENAHFFRVEMTKLGFNIVPGEHPIVPIMLGDAVFAGRMAERLLELGVYAIGFSYPVVPQGKARIRVQVSAAHTREDLEFAIKAFAQVRDELAAS